jgi:hypothetical protein
MNYSPEFANKNAGGVSRGDDLGPRPHLTLGWYYRAVSLIAGVTIISVKRSISDQPISPGQTKLQRRTACIKNTPLSGHLSYWTHGE